MIILAFIVFAIHKLFIVEFVSASAHWASDVFASAGMDHAAYYVGLYWMNNGVLFWGLYFAEILFLNYLMRKGLTEHRQAQAS